MWGIYMKKHIFILTFWFVQLGLASDKISQKGQEIKPIVLINECS